MLGYNKNYAILVLNCILKSSKKTLLEDIETIIQKTIRTHKTLKRALINIEE